MEIKDFQTSSFDMQHTEVCTIRPKALAVNELLKHAHKLLCTSECAVHMDVLGVSSPLCCITAACEHRPEECRHWHHGEAEEGCGLNGEKKTNEEVQTEGGIQARAAF